MNKVMNVKDAISAAEAECYITIGGSRYFFMQLINLEAKIEKEKIQIPILGKRTKGNKTVGWKGTGKAKMHYNTSVFRKMLEKYKDTGSDDYFDIQVINNDPISSVGTQAVMLKGCNIDGGVLAKFDANADFLDEEISFTFEDFEVGTGFTNISGMKGDI